LNNYNNEIENTPKLSPRSKPSSRFNTITAFSQTAYKDTNYNICNTELSPKSRNVVKIPKNSILFNTDKNFRIVRRSLFPGKDIRNTSMTPFQKIEILKSIKKDNFLTKINYRNLMLEDNTLGININGNYQTISTVPHKDMLPTIGNLISAKNRIKTYSASNNFTPERLSNINKELNESAKTGFFNKNSKFTINISQKNMIEVKELMKTVPSFRILKNIPSKNKETFLTNDKLKISELEQSLKSVRLKTPENYNSNGKEKDIKFQFSDKLTSDFWNKPLKNKIKKEKEDMLMHIKSTKNRVIK
jgi:hypothetical protein